MVHLSFITEEVPLCQSDAMASLGLRTLRLCECCSPHALCGISSIHKHHIEVNVNQPICFLWFISQESLMKRVKKQLHEWDENLKDDSLPTNAVGQPLFSVLQMDCRRARTCAPTSLYLCSLCSSSFRPFILLFGFSLVSVRLLLQSGSLSAHRRCSAAPAAEDWQRHPETALWAGHHGPGKERSPRTPLPCPTTSDLWHLYLP